MVSIKYRAGLLYRSYINIGSPDNKIGKRTKENVDSLYLIPLRVVLLLSCALETCDVFWCCWWVPWCLWPFSIPDLSCCLLAEALLPGRLVIGPVFLWVMKKSLTWPNFSLLVKPSWVWNRRLRWWVFPRRNGVWVYRAKLGSDVEKLSEFVGMATTWTGSRYSAPSPTNKPTKGSLWEICVGRIKVGK